MKALHIIYHYQHAEQYVGIRLIQNSKLEAYDR